jgi:CBS domain-containing protein
MAETNITPEAGEEKLRAFTRATLRDLRVLEMMIERGLLERDPRLIGAEQEMFLVDESMRPAPVAMETLEGLESPPFTHELARFNLESTLPPVPFRGDCLRRLEESLRNAVDGANAAAREFGASVLLTGILPTLRLSDLGLHNMAPVARYEALNRALMRLRGGEFHLHIRGVDEYEGTHDTVMLEACNTSFQLHVQVTPGEFARLYNIAQLISAPLVAAAGNSPLLLGQRLWHETRVALFERTIDSRSSAQLARGQLPRVSLGDRWVRESALEVFRQEIARFPAILSMEVTEDPETCLEAGGAPALQALCLFNSTVWRWNRVCYGVFEGKPHLRIENRVLPAGPTVVDEVANAGLFYGLMTALTEECEDLEERLEFEHVAANFREAAVSGLRADFTWMDGKRIAASDLLLHHLIPLAREGLRGAGVDPTDTERCLGVVEERVASGQTGARWSLSSLEALAGSGPRESIHLGLTAAMLERQRRGEPVHRWTPANPRDAGDWRLRFRTVREIMTTDLITVRPEDVVELAASVMDWERIPHVPVEDADGRPVGLISARTFLRAMGDRPRGDVGESVPVEKMMDRDPAVISADTPILQAMEDLVGKDTECLLVVEGERLVGIVTAWDFVKIAAAALRDPSAGKGAGGG